MLRRETGDQRRELVQYSCVVSAIVADLSQDRSLTDWLDIVDSAHLQI